MSDDTLIQSQPKVLFIPVSQEVGSGEYLRCMGIAERLQETQPDIELHFIVNKRGLIIDKPFIQHHATEGPPTFCEEQVEEVLRRLRPQVVIFDNALRRKIAKVAHELGAWTAFISSRPKKRRVGFDPRKTQFINQHWIITQPTQHRLSTIERLIRPGSQDVEFFSAMQTTGGAPDDSLRALIPETFLRNFVLFCPGGGSGEINGTPTGSFFQTAARDFACNTNIPTVLIAGPQANVTLKRTDKYFEISSLPTKEFSQLLSKAELFVSGAGSQLLQALALNKPCLAIQAQGKDQKQRLKGLLKQDVVATAPRTPQGLSMAAEELIQNPEELGNLKARVVAGGFLNGLEPVAEKIAQKALASKTSVR